MRLGTRLRRIMAMMILLLGLLAGLGVASAQEDAPIPSGEAGPQTPRVADGASATLPSSATVTPLSSPSPIQAATPLSPTPDTPSSMTGNPDSAGSAPAKSADKTGNQAVHTVHFDPADGSKPTQSTVKTGTLATPPEHNPVREGFRFDGWTYDGRPYDFRTPVLRDMTLKAQWSKTTDWTLSPDHGPATGARLAISPPDRQEPQFASIQAVGNQFIGLAGDGRLYAWTQEGTPNQVPAPAQAPDGFRYLQAAAGSRWQAALGSDQRIYTWTTGQATPTILDAGQGTRFASISMNDDRLLAMDRQSRVHVFQASQSDTQDPAAKPAEQATTSLPGQAQAVTALTSGSQALIVDADGQAWIWETSNIGNAKPARVKQDPGMRTVQVQALSQGLLLLDTDGHARYLADSTTSPTAVSLPESMQASRITADKSQGIIVDKDGRLWAWKPDGTPKRADDGSQPYTQAASIDGKIIALDRQGRAFTWSLDAQDKPGKPARIDTTQAPILESASMDGQALTLTRNNDAWQTDMPARQPGPAIITIAGKQDGQPFTKNLNYTADQTLTREGQQSTTHQVTFNTAKGSQAPEPQQVDYPYGRVRRPSPDPTREGYLFDGWFIGEVAYDFSKPVTKDLTLTAKWTPENRNNTWKINPDQGSQLGNESTTITPPGSASRGIRFGQISGGKDDNTGFSLAVGSDGNAYAWGNNIQSQLGDGTIVPRYTPVKVNKPTYPDMPADFTYVQVSAGGYHSLAIGSDGNAYAWGDNSYSQLGDGTSTSRTTPVKVSKPTSTPTNFTYVQVSAGQFHSLAMGSDGNAYAWGNNSRGQIGDGTETTRYTPVKVNKPTYPDMPADFTYVQVSAGGDHSLAVGSDGYAYAWGKNEYGELGIHSHGVYTDSFVPERVRDPANPNDASKGLKATQVSGGNVHSLAVGSDGYAYAWGYNRSGQLGNDSISKWDDSIVPVPVVFNLQLVITGVRFDLTPVSDLKRGDGSSVTVLTPAHAPGTVSVSVNYTLGGAPQQPDTSLRYTYLPVTPTVVVPRAGGEGILLALTMGMTGMGGVLASCRHRREQYRLSHASHE